jgi:hypothetical protein
MAVMSMPKCFVIMPISTPKEVVGNYSGDEDHFIHVLDHLFVPAIELAGLEPQKPVMTGADLIHAEIIKRLEEADLVLCDMSRLNANVFFELGIRTALDRPAALVKDDQTSQVPFDTGVINHHVYDSSLAPWKLKDEVQALSEHLKETKGRSEGRNALWRYFGLTQRAEPAHIENPLEEKVDLILQEVSKSNRRQAESEEIEIDRLADLPVVRADPDIIRELAPSLNDKQVEGLVEVVRGLGGFSISPHLVGAFGNHVILELGTYWIYDEHMKRADETAEAAGISLTFLGGRRPDS